VSWIVQNACCKTRKVLGCGKNLKKLLDLLMLIAILRWLLAEHPRIALVSEQIIETGIKTALLSVSSWTIRI
jgi:hypothetical protein